MFFLNNYFRGKHYVLTSSKIIFKESEYERSKFEILRRISFPLII